MLKKGITIVKKPKQSGKYIRRITVRRQKD